MPSACDLLATPAIIGPLAFEKGLLFPPARPPGPAEVPSVAEPPPNPACPGVLPGNCCWIAEAFWPLVIRFMICWPMTFTAPGLPGTCAGLPNPGCGFIPGNPCPGCGFIPGNPCPGCGFIPGKPCPGCGFIPGKPCPGCGLVPVRG